MITAHFSNGYTDIYQGRRDVRAAWMITCRETGDVVASGHSVDRKRAESTARSYISSWVYMPSPRLDFRAKAAWARELGFETFEACRDHYQALRAKYHAEHAIEIVDL